MASKRELQKRCDAYKKLLCGTFEYIAENRSVLNNNAEMAGDCRAYLEQLRSVSKKQKNWRLEFHQPWEIQITKENVCGVKGNTKLLVDGYVNTENGMFKDQVLAVSVKLSPEIDVLDPVPGNHGALYRGSETIIRRFHFDYDTSIESNDRPRSHLQYGGVFRHLGATDNLNYELFRSLRTPRIPVPPLDLVQVLHIFLTQFETNISQITSELRWKNLLKESDKIWLSGYFAELAAHLSQAESCPLYERQCCPVD